MNTRFDTPRRPNVPSPAETAWTLIMPPADDATVLETRGDDQATHLEPSVRGEAAAPEDLHEAATLLVPGARQENGRHRPDADATVLDHDADTVIVDDRVVGTLDGDRTPTVVSSLPLAPSGPDDAPVDDTGGRTGTPAAGPSGAHPIRDPRVRYVLEGTAGEGGMGTVYVARDLDLLRRVALKELSSRAAHEQSARTRFVREVQVTAQLDHPHIVPVYSLETAEGGRPAYAMKLVEGKTFAELIAETRAAFDGGAEPDEQHDLATRLEHFLKVCDAIAYAHDRGVVHRDLKPANLMLGRHNEVYVMDWGICRLLANHDTTTVAAQAVNLEGAAGQTAYGAIVGTPLYMSPEQAQGRHTELDARSDQCALGLILFELVTLQRPFAGKTLAAILQQAASGERQSIGHAFGRPIPGELAAIITKATAVDKGARYAGVDALAADLRRYLRGDAVDARPDTAWQNLVRRLARHRQQVALAVLGLVIASLATVTFLVWRGERRLEAQQARERRLHAFVTDVSEQADMLQTRLLEVKADLEGLAAAAAQALSGGVGVGGALPWPESTTPSNALDSEVLATAPGVARADVDASARRLLGVRAAETHLLETIRDVLGGGGRDGSGLLEMRIGLANGLKLVQPSASLSSTYPDPRLAPWYTAVATRRAFHWSLIEARGTRHGRELAFGAPLTDDAGTLVGATGLVLSLDRVLLNLLDDQSVPGAVATLLYDDRGTLLASEAAASGRSASGDAFATQLRADELRAALRGHDAGFLETDRFGAPHVVGVAVIRPFNWLLVTLADESRLH